MTVHSCRIAFFDAKPYDRDSFNSVNEREFHYDIRYFKGHLTPDSVPLTRGTDVACIFVNDTANREVIRNLKENGVKLLALRCAGFNNVDLKAAEEAELPVVRVPQYSPYAVAEHAVALMLSLNRKIHRAYWRTRDGNFSLHGLMGFDMNGKTAGIIGTGKIGQKVAQNLQGFGCRILAYSRRQNADPALGIEYCSLEELYAKSDIISLHTPLSNQTRYMIDKKAIDQMKDGVILINCARGELMRVDDIIEGIETRKIGALGLDVIEHEEGIYHMDRRSDILANRNMAYLRQFPNVTMTQHIAFYTEEAVKSMAESGIVNVVKCLKKQDNPNLIC